MKLVHSIVNNFYSVQYENIKLNIREIYLSEFSVILLDCATGILVKQLLVTALDDNDIFGVFKEGNDIYITSISLEDYELYLKINVVKRPIKLKETVANNENFSYPFSICCDNLVLNFNENDRPVFVLSWIRNNIASISVVRSNVYVRVCDYKKNGKPCSNKGYIYKIISR